MEWTEARVRRAMELRNNGCSLAEVAAQLGGVTRCAVSGKLARAGFDGGVKVPGRRRKTLTFETRKKADRTARTVLPDKPVRFLDRRVSDGLGNGQCCAILNHGADIDELMVCGGAIPLESAFEFCAAHQAIYLNPTRRQLAA